MIALFRQFKILLLILPLISAPVAASVVVSLGAPDNYAPGDTIFNEIVLTEEGVTAIDTEGHEWYYDFDNSVFVVGEQPPDGFEYSFNNYSDVPIEERATELKKVKPFESGDVTVKENEYVDDDITAWGQVTVKGWVKGDVVSVRDRVLITETAVVEGDVMAPKVTAKEGAIIGGKIIESENPLGDTEFPIPFTHEFLLVIFIITMGFMFLGFIILAVMPKQIGNIENCIVNNKSRSIVLGFLIVLVLPALVVLLAITIVGIVLIPILPVVYFWAMLLGIVATGKAIAEFLSKKFLGRKLNQIMLGMAGIVLLMTPWLISSAMFGAAADSDTEIAAGFLLFLAISIMLFPVFAGLGASFLTRFGFRSYVSGSPFGPRPTKPATPSPAPPPIPDSPFSQKEETPPGGSRISEENKD